MIFQLSYVSRVRERDEISTAHSTHTHHRPKTKHCSHQDAIVCPAAIDILTRASGVRQCRGASSLLQEQGAATNSAEAPSSAPAQSTSTRERVTTDDAKVPHHSCAIRGRPMAPDDHIIVALRVLPTAPRHCLCRPKQCSR